MLNGPEAKKTKTKQNEAKQTRGKWGGMGLKVQATKHIEGQDETKLAGQLKEVKRDKNVH